MAALVVRSIYIQGKKYQTEYFQRTTHSKRQVVQRSTNSDGRPRIGGFVFIADMDVTDLHLEIFDDICSQFLSKRVLLLCLI